MQLNIKIGVFISPSVFFSSSILHIRTFSIIFDFRASLDISIF